MHSEHAFRYIETDIPEGVTIDRWRSDRAEDAARRRLVRLPPWRVGRRRGAIRSRDDG